MKCEHECEKAIKNEIIIAYRLIRIKARDMINPCTDEELGQYVRGIVDMQTEIYTEQLKEQNND